MNRIDPLDELGLSLGAGAAEIYLVRHADAVPEDGLNGARYEDYQMHPLSERGRAQAEATAQRCAELRLAAVYASPIRRARETAAAIAESARVDLIEDDALREVQIGTPDADGEEMPMRERLEKLATIAIRDGSWNSIPGTEPSAGVRARMEHALDVIAVRHPGERVVAVSHAGSINAYLGLVAGTTHDFVFPLANASISVVRINGTRRLLMSANETAHLRGAVPPRVRA
ncbi:MAG: histidine phosphatase family protein [Candidatus Elarobacter sp.]